MLEDLYEILANGWTVIVSIASRIKSHFSCGGSNGFRLNAFDHRFHAFAQRLAVKFWYWRFAVDSEALFEQSPEGRVFVERIDCDVNHWDGCHAEYGVGAS